MKTSAEFLSALDNAWNQFSDAWKKSHAKASEKSIHDLRVNTRRLIAAIQLTGAFCPKNDIRKLQKSLKKLLKGMGPLRDVQVQLETVAAMRKMDSITKFKRRLQRREKEEIANIEHHLKRRRKQRLDESFHDLRSAFSRVRESGSEDRFQRSVERFVSSRRREYLKAKQRFDRLRPFNEEAFHEMRIALKKLRYSVESAEPVLGAAKEQTRGMRLFQQLMGDTRDVELLRIELENWAKSKGKKIALVPVLERLENHREGLLRKIIESSHRLEQISEGSAKPVAETTAVTSVPLARDGYLVPPRDILDGDER